MIKLKHLIFEYSDNDISIGDYVKIDPTFGSYGGMRGKVINIVKFAKGTSTAGMCGRSMRIPPQVVLKLPNIENLIEVPMFKVKKVVEMYD